MNKNFDYLFKFILIGDSSVGKSCLLNRFVQGKFKMEHDPTLGVQFGCKNITVDGLALKIQIWDTAGQQSFKSITRSYYKGSIVAFLIFDISRRQSFDNLNKWIFEIKNYSHQNTMIALVGNKTDLHAKRQISTQQARKFAQSSKYEYFEVSALNGENVSLPFQKMSKKILLRIKSKELDPQSQQSYGIKAGRKRTEQSGKQRNRMLSSHSSPPVDNKCQC